MRGGVSGVHRTPHCLELAIHYLTSMTTTTTERIDPSTHSAAEPPSRIRSARRLRASRAASLAFATVAAAIAPCITSAEAQSNETVRFEQRSLYPKVRGGWTSHHGQRWNLPDWGFQTFDDFRFPSGEILTRFQWFGYYRDSENLANNPVGPSTVEWTVTIHEDAGGSPGAELFSQTVSGSEVATEYVGTIDVAGAFSENYYRFELTFAEPFNAKPGRRYWISPNSRGTKFSPLFGWYPGLAGRKESHQLYLGHEMAWQAPTGGNGAIAEPVLGNRAMVLIGRPADDLDGDGMDDSWEELHGLDPSMADADDDPDGDDLNNLREFELGSDPRIADTDGDGLSDGVESNHGTYVDASDTGTSPVLADTDGDRLPDGSEVPGTIPAEMPGRSDTNPNSADSDGDGYDDRVELSNGFDPNANDSHPELVRLDGLLGGDLSDPGDDGATGVGMDASRNPNASTWGAFNAFDNQLGLDGDAWGNIEPSDFPWWDWVEIELATPTVLTHFTIASGSSATEPSSDPHVWEIQGSNDGGQTWDVIFSRVDPIESVWTERSQVVRFDAGMHFATPPAYKRIRFFNDRPLESWRLQLGELEFFGIPHQTSITSIRRNDDGSIKLEWDSIPGVSYAIDGSGDLLNWREMVSSLPSGGAKTAHVFGASSQADAASGFFRVRER